MLRVVKLSAIILSLKICYRSLCLSVVMLSTTMLSVNMLCVIKLIAVKLSVNMCVIMLRVVRLIGEAPRYMLMFPLLGEIVEQRFFLVDAGPGPRPRT